MGCVAADAAEFFPPLFRVFLAFNGVSAAAAEAGSHMRVFEDIFMALFANLIVLLLKKMVVSRCMDSMTHITLALRYGLVDDLCSKVAVPVAVKAEFRGLLHKQLFRVSLVGEMAGVAHPGFERPVFVPAFEITFGVASETEVGHVGKKYPNCL